MVAPAWRGWAVAASPVQGDPCEPPARHPTHGRRLVVHLRVATCVFPPPMTGLGTSRTRWPLTATTCGSGSPRGARRSSASPYCPSSPLPVEDELTESGAQHHGNAACRLNKMRQLSAGSDEAAEVDTSSPIPHDPRRRPRLQQAIDRAGLAALIDLSLQEHSENPTRRPQSQDPCHAPDHPVRFHVSHARTPDRARIGLVLSRIWSRGGKARGPLPVGRGPLTGAFAW
jgi:hypothetical protein